MALFGKKDEIHEKAYVKDHTRGTSNEVSFSVLDAAKREADGADGKQAEPRIGRLSLFTLPGSRRPNATPQREKGLNLPSGGFVSTDTGSVSAIGRARDEGMSLGEAYAAAGIESSDNMLMGQETPVTIQGIGGRRARSQEGKSNAAPAAHRPQVAQEAPREAKAAAGGKTKRRGRRALAVVAAIAGCAVLAVGAIFAFRYFGSSLDAAPAGSVQGVLAKIAKADKTLVEMDTVLSEPVQEETISHIEEVLKEVPSAEKLLSSAKTSVQSLQSGTTAGSEKQAVEDARQAVEARLTMLDAGERVLKEASVAANGIAFAEAAWNKLMEGDSAARLSAELAGADTVSNNLEASTEKAEEARSLMAEALAQYKKAAQQNPSVDFAPMEAYIEKRMESLDHAIASNLALAEEDTDRAVSENEAYSKADAEAVEMARRLPSSYSDLIAEAYSAKVQQDVAAYTEARSKAGAVDERLRAYLRDNR